MEINDIFINCFNILTIKSLLLVAVLFAIYLFDVTGKECSLYTGKFNTNERLQFGLKCVHKCHLFEADIFRMLVWLRDWMKDGDE